MAISSLKNTFVLPTMTLKQTFLMELITFIKTTCIIIFKIIAIEYQATFYLSLARLDSILLDITTYY